MALTNKTKKMKIILSLNEPLYSYKGTAKASRLAAAKSSTLRLPVSVKDNDLTSECQW